MDTSCGYHPDELGQGALGHWKCTGCIISLAVELTLRSVPYTIGGPISRLPNSIAGRAATLRFVWNAAVISIFDIMVLDQNVELGL